MRCLLTGCNGFIAKNIIHYFDNFQITGLDISKSEFVPTLVQNVSEPISGDFDVVIHAASGFSDDVDMFNANFLGTKRCIEVATRSACPLIYISSAEAYEPRVFGQDLFQRLYCPAISYLWPSHESSRWTHSK